MKMAVNYRTRGGWNTIAEVLNSVFGKKTKKGKNYNRVRQSKWKINNNRFAVFLYLAKAVEGGGWTPPYKNVDWLNIPDRNNKAFTMIELDKQHEGDACGGKPVPAEEWAVFVHDDKVPEKKTYRFYGVFKCTGPGSQGIWIFHRQNLRLVAADWKAD
ncbi:MAG: hypothetical protein LBI85_07265 [Spirochaetaceae bacterium]|jgi:hypothetical protein|nr:hypothetical protein [Spirochaetaceae bacterium]